MQQQKKASLKLDESDRRRKEYRAPQVRDYGNIRDITKAPGNNNMPDGLGTFTAP